MGCGCSRQPPDGSVAEPGGKPSSRGEAYTEAVPPTPPAQKDAASASVPSLGSGPLPQLKIAANSPLRNPSIARMLEFRSSSSPRRRRSMVGRRVSVAQSPAQAFPLAFVAMSLDGRDSSMPTGQSPVTSGVITVRGVMKHIVFEEFYPPLRQSFIPEHGPLLLKTADGERNSAMLYKDHFVQHQSERVLGDIAEVSPTNNNDDDDGKDGSDSGSSDVEEMGEWKWHIAAAAGEQGKLRDWALDVPRDELIALLDRPDNDGHTPLHLATFHGWTGCISLLLEMRVEVNCRDKWGRTPLHLAARRSEDEALAMLLKKGALPDAQDNDGVTPVMYAIYMSRIACVRALLEVCDAQIHDKRKKNAVHWAACAGNDLAMREVLQRVAAELLVAEDTDGMTPLLYSASAGSLDCVRLLLSQIGTNADALNQRNQQGNSAIHYASASGGLEIIKELLRAGGAVAPLNQFQATPLHFAALGGYVDIARLLVEKGASVHATDRQNKTPLFWAAFNGHVQIVRLLLEHGSEITLHDTSSITATPLDWTCVGRMHPASQAEILRLLSGEVLVERKAGFQQDELETARAAFEVRYQHRRASIQKAMLGVDEEEPQTPAGAIVATPSSPSKPPMAKGTLRKSIDFERMMLSESTTSTPRINRLPNGRRLSIGPSLLNRPVLPPLASHATSKGGTGDAHQSQNSMGQTSMDSPSGKNVDLVKIEEMLHNIRKYQAKLLEKDVSDYIEVVVRFDFLLRGQLLETVSHEFTTAESVLSNRNYLKSERAAHACMDLTVPEEGDQEDEMVVVHPSLDMLDAAEDESSFVMADGSYDMLDISVEFFSSHRKNRVFTVRRTREQLIASQRRMDIYGWGTGCRIDVPEGQGQDPSLGQPGDQGKGWASFFFYPSFKQIDNTVVDLFEDINFSIEPKNARRYADVKRDALQELRLVARV